MKKILIIISFLLMLNPLGAMESLSTGDLKADLANKIQDWDERKFIAFNDAFLKALEAQSLKTKYQDRKINETFTYFKFKNYLNILIATANANEAQDDYLLCNYGGWMSKLNTEQKCLAPWSSSIKSDDDLSDFGPFYTKYYSCGANQFRCNPIVFGGGSDGKGHCVFTNDKDPNQATSDCIKKLQEIGPISHLNALKDDPKKMALYIGMAAETIRYCNDYQGAASFCDELVEIFETSTSKIMSCIEGASLYKFLPSVVSPLNEKEIDTIANNLASNFSVYQADLEKRQQEARDKNTEVYKKAIGAYTSSEKTTNMIEKLRSNVTKCLMDSCERRNIKKNSKSRTKSLAFCARYVKHGMLGPDNYLSSYPNYIFAVNAGTSLENAGFTNLLNNPAFSSLTPETAPVGAIIVYRKVGAKGGKPGHIEVKTDNSEYISDFVNSEPTRVGGMRVPIGIYIKVPKDIKKELVEIPES